MNQFLSYELEATVPLAAESGLFSSLCTIQQRSNTLSVTGQVDLTDWNDIPTLSNIACQFSIQRPFMPNQGATGKLPQQTDTETMYHILLQGYYPQILQQNQAVVDGRAYEIMAVESDSQKQMTRLACRIYTL